MHTNSNILYSIEPMRTSQPTTAVGQYNGGEFADVLIDRVQLGLEVLFPLPAKDYTVALASMLQGARKSVHRSSSAFLKGGANLNNFTLEVERIGGVSMQGKIRLVSASSQLAISSSSHIIINLLRTVRPILVEPMPLALDGASNLIGFRDDYRDYLALQLDAAAAVVDAFASKVAEAVGLGVSELSGRFWVQQVEICRDHYCEHAEHIVRHFAGTPVPGARSTRQRHLNSVCLSWHDGTKAPVERKIYAKCADLVRFEIAARSRSAVVAMLRCAGEPTPRPADGLAGQAVTQELAALARAALPYLEEAERFATDAIGPNQATGFDFMVDLAPLSLLALPPAPGGNGRPRSATTTALARRALALLLDEGSFDTRGVHTGNPVLEVLRRLSETGLLQAGGRGGRIFTIAPKFEAIRQALRDANQRAPPQGPAGC
jgi:hypothetical protein